MALGGRAWRGYFPVGGELTSGRPDLKEGLYFGAELDDHHPLVRAGTPMHGRNLFPSRIPLFRETVLDYMAAMSTLGHRLMEGMALSLGLKASYFADRYTKDPLVLFRIFHYPRATRAAEDEPCWGVGEHADYGVLTILKQDAAEGLQVKSQSRWIAAPPIAGAFLCNIGDMLDRMTGGRYHSTPHRVSSPTERKRLSFPFFFEPNFNAEVHNAAVFGHMVSGRLPIPAIPALENLASLRFARPAYAMTLVGRVTSQGDVAMRADIARSTFGVDGTGVTVGALSDSFNCLGGAAAGVASGDLPAGIVVLEEIGDCTDAIDEGRALAEVIHDVAPGTAIAVHSAANGQASFAQGIIDLANAGAKVITDDIFYFAEPMFQDGIIAQAVDLVKARGISYFSAAGNDGRQSYESPFRGSGQFRDLGEGPEELHDFDPGPGVDTCQQITIPVGGTLRQIFQWDEPFFSVSGPPGSQSDLDIILTDAACNLGLAGSAHVNVGGDPFEVFSFGNADPATTFGMIILQFSGPDPGLMKTVNVGSGSITIDQFDTRSGTSFGHRPARGGLGVGAADYRDTPAFGQSPPLIETSSSAGGTHFIRYRREPPRHTRGPRAAGHLGAGWSRHHVFWRQ
jgi:2-oxoglutarate-Fe(II)-dependent oxygenase superfamily protein